MSDAFGERWVRVVRKNICRMRRKVTQVVARELFKGGDQGFRCVGIAGIGIGLVFKTPRYVVHHQGGQFGYRAVQQRKAQQGRMEAWLADPNGLGKPGMRDEQR